MAGILTLLGESAGAFEAVKTIARENAKFDRAKRRSTNPAREKTLDQLRLELVYAQADQYSNDWMTRDSGRKRAEKLLAAIKRKIAAKRKAGQWDEHLTDYYLGKVTQEQMIEARERDAVKKNPARTTAQYRAAAREAESRLQWKRAARLYRAAVAAYPSNAGALAKADKEKLLSLARQAELAARDAELAARDSNPRGRSKGSVNRPSQITKKKPTKRLVKRRKITLRSPRGLFANPVALFPWVIEYKTGTNTPGVASWRIVAGAKSQPDAERIGRAYANANRVQVRLRKLDSKVRQY